MIDLPDTPYWNKYNGRFFGLLKWEQMDALWLQLHDYPSDWYVFDFEKPQPSLVSSAEDFKQFLNDAMGFLLSRKINEHGGLVYVDEQTAPEFIKIFDPRKMGSSCGGSGGRTYPRWTISIIKPDEGVPVEVDEAPKGVFAKLIEASQFK